MPTATIDSQAAVQQFRTDGTIFDRFARANSAVTLDSLDSGETWAVETGSGAVWGVSEQRPYAVSGSNTISGAVVETNISTAVLIELDVTVTAGHSAGIIYRSDGNHTSGNKWLALLTISGTAGQLTIQRISAAVATTIATVTGLPIVEGQTVKLGVHLFGSTHKIWINDILYREVSDATHLTRTKHGIIITANGTKNMDNFFVREVGANQLIQMRASVLNTVTQTMTMRASILDVETQTMTMRAAVTAQTLQRLDMRAAIQTRVRVIETAGDVITDEDAERITHEDAGDFSVQRTSDQDSFIWTLDTQFLNSHEAKFTARANIRATVPRTMTMLAKLTAQSLQSMQMRGRIAPRLSKMMTMRARLLAAPSGSIQLRASVRKTVTQDMTMRARIRRIEFHIQMLASISNSVTQTMEMRARLTPQDQAKIDMRASINQIVPQIMQMRGRVLPDTRLSMKALLLGFTTASLEVTYDVAERVTARLPVEFRVTGGARVSQVMTMRAKIASPRTASLTVEFAVHNPMPVDVATRPTERVKVP